jgi:hypothetical protein
LNGDDRVQTMTTETISDRREHIRSVGVTALAALVGVGAALVSAAITGGDPSSAAVSQQAQIIVLAAIVLQLSVIRLAGIYDEDEFGVKHALFVAFMTFSMWFITWGILLTSQTSQPAP